VGGGWGKNLTREELFEGVERCREAAGRSDAIDAMNDNRDSQEDIHTWKLPRRTRAAIERSRSGTRRR
jgi:hypothetical protein